MEIWRTLSAKEFVKAYYEMQRRLEQYDKACKDAEMAFNELQRQKKAPKIHRKEPKFMARGRS